LLTGSVTFRSSSVAATGPDHQMEMNAREAFAAGRFDEALALFAKLYAETLHPVYLRNIGRCHQKMREPQKAIDSFHDYLAKNRKIAPDETAEIEGYIHEMEALKEEQTRAGVGTGDKPAPVPAVRPPLPPPSPSPAPLPLASAPNSISASEPTSLGATVALESNGTNRSEHLETSAPLYTRWWLWAGVGAVVVGGVTAAVLLSGGTSRPDCPPGVVRCQ
jgi:tetratricopeptide (TPR) repeat protein